MRRLSFGFLCLLLAACGTSPTLSEPQASAPDANVVADAGVDLPATGCEVDGIGYTTLSGARVRSAQGPTLEAPLRAERMRMKPQPAIHGEYLRLFGEVPALLSQSEALLGVPQARWAREPVLSSFALHSLIRAGYAACGPYVGRHATWLNAQTSAEISASCNEMLQEAWLRSPSDIQVQRCADVATGRALPGGPRGQAAPASERWQYACAQALTAPEFLTYGSAP